MEKGKARKGKGEKELINKGMDKRREMKGGGSIKDDAENKGKSTGEKGKKRRKKVQKVTNINSIGKGGYGKEKNGKRKQKMSD